MKVMLVFDAVILLFGIYMVISSLQMKKSGLRPLSLPSKFAKTQTFAYAADLLQFPTNQKKTFSHRQPM